jgi:hypothetical protein
VARRRWTLAAVAFGLMSAASPWLWGIHTRRVSRDVLMADGQVEGHALRLGATRWVWHPYRSARVMRHATWVGETKPTAAIGFVYPQESQGPAAVPVLDTIPADKLAAARVAMRETFKAQNPLSQNQLEERFSLTRAQAREVRLEVTAISNGHAS